MNNKLLNIIEFIPISALGIIVSITNENGVNWNLAFITGACLALIEKAFLMAKRFPLDRIFLGADIFFDRWWHWFPVRHSFDIVYLRVAFSGNTICGIVSSRYFNGIFN